MTSPGKIVISSTKAESLAQLCLETIFMANAIKELCEMNGDCDGSIVTPATLESIGAAFAESTIRKLDVVIAALGGPVYCSKGGDHA